MENKCIPPLSHLTVLRLENSFTKTTKKIFFGEPQPPKLKPNADSRKRHRLLDVPGQGFGGSGSSKQLVLNIRNLEENLFPKNFPRVNNVVRSMTNRLN